MRSRAERKKYKQCKYIFKHIDVKLTYKHSLYTLKWTQREGPLILLDLYTYTLTDTSLDNIIERYNDIRTRNIFDKENFE